MQIALFVDFEAHPTEAEHFAELITSHARATREEEPGCLAFVVTRSLQNPDRFLLYELYADAAALAAHRATDRLKRFRDAMTPLVTGITRHETGVVGAF